MNNIDALLSDKNKIQNFEYPVFVKYVKNQNNINTFENTDNTF